MSIGPRRQLSLKQHQGIVTALLLGTIALQAGLAIFGQGKIHILMPAIGLAVLAGATTFCSAELILKSRSKLRESWKAVAALLAITGVSFLLRDSAKTLLLRVILSDVTAMVLGNFIVISQHAATRKN